MSNENNNKVSEQQHFNQELAELKETNKALERELSSYRKIFNFGGLARKIFKYREAASLTSPFPDPEFDDLMAIVVNRSLVGSVLSIFIAFGTLALLSFQAIIFTRQANLIEAQSIQMAISEQGRLSDQARSEMRSVECANGKDLYSVVSSILSSYEMNIAFKHGFLDIFFPPAYPTENGFMETTHILPYTIAIGGNGSTYKLRMAIGDTVMEIAEALHKCDTTTGVGVDEYKQVFPIKKDLELQSRYYQLVNGASVRAMDGPVITNIETQFLYGTLADIYYYPPPPWARQRPNSQS